MPLRSLLSVALLVSSTIAGAQQNPSSSSRQVINRPDARPGGVLSPVVRVGDLLFLSGVTGSKPGSGGLADGGIEGQTRQALENVKSALTLAGATMQDVAKCTVFLADIKDFGGMNSVYREYFPTDPPARSTVAVAALVAPNALIEIECIAATPQKR